MVRPRASTGVCSSFFDILLRVILAERKLYTDLRAKSQASIHEAAEGADFAKLDPDYVGVAGAWSKLK